MFQRAGRAWLYSDERLGVRDVDLTQTGRAFFVKLAYAVLL